MDDDADRRGGPVGFDLDLTLIDSRPAILAAWERVARDTGVAVDLAAVDTRLGLKLEDEAGYWFPPSEIDLAVEGYRRHYLRLAPALTTALPGAAAALAAVTGAGAAAVIITAKHPVSVGPSLAAAGLPAVPVHAHVHGPEKAAVLERLQATVYVGDTPADMAAARSAGARAVGVATGSFDATNLFAAGAHDVLVTLEQFPSWYGAFRAGAAT